MTMTNLPVDKLYTALDSALGTDRRHLRFFMESTDPEYRAVYLNHVDVYISCIESDRRGQGIAGKALRAVCTEADRLGIALCLMVESYALEDGSKLSFEDLICWYERCGFALVDGEDGDKMVRLPRRNRLAA